MSPDRPEPRPALRRAADGSVHPASARTSSLAVDPDAVAAVAKAARKRKSDGGKDAKDKDRAKHEDRVELSVTVPRTLRKALRRKAEAHGWSAEEAAAHVLRAWVDG